MLFYTMQASADDKEDGKIQVEGEVSVMAAASLCAAPTLMGNDEEDGDVEAEWELVEHEEVSGAPEIDMSVGRQIEINRSAVTEYVNTIITGAINQMREEDEEEKDDNSSDEASDDGKDGKSGDTSDAEGCGSDTEHDKDAGGEPGEREKDEDDGQNDKNDDQVPSGDSGQRHAGDTCRLQNEVNGLGDDTRNNFINQEAVSCYVNGIVEAAKKIVDAETDDETMHNIKGNAKSLAINGDADDIGEVPTKHQAESQGMKEEDCVEHHAYWEIRPNDPECLKARLNERFVNGNVTGKESDPEEGSSRRSSSAQPGSSSSDSDVEISGCHSSSASDDDVRGRGHDVRGQREAENAQSPVVIETEDVIISSSAPPACSSSPKSRSSVDENSRQTATTKAPSRPEVYVNGMTSHLRCSSPER